MKLEELICVAVVLSLLLSLNECAFCKFTNLVCHSYNKSVIEFQMCHIKAVGREDNYIKVLAHIKEVVHDGEVTINLLKRANGWKPFLYNVTFDACKFLKNPKSNPVAEFFYNVMRDFSNVNHTCPYNHDLLLDKFRISQNVVKLPFPIGEYAVDTLWTVNGKLWARVNGSCQGSVDG